MALLEDTGQSVGLGVNGQLKNGTKLGADLQWTHNESRYPETITLLGGGTVFPAGIPGPLPDIENRLVRLKLFASYPVQKQAELRLDLIREYWQTDDWSWMFADGTTFTYGTTTDGTQVQLAPRQTSTFVGLRYIYRFK